MLSTYCFVANWEAGAGVLSDRQLLSSRQGSSLISPNEMLVVPIVKDELVAAELGMFVNVLLEPLSLTL
jgi:hypothetical protein